MELSDIGWNEIFQQALDTLELPGAIPARVTYSVHGHCRVLTAGGEVQAMAAGRVVAVVGDWVALEELGHGQFIVREVLPRHSVISRLGAGGRKGEDAGVADEQVMAANVDRGFIVTGLDRDFNLRRIERYTTLLFGCGVTPVVILNKADLCQDAEARRLEVEAIAPGVEVVALSAKEGQGLEPLEVLLTPGATSCLLGSSGAGKSTLINRLTGREVQRTGEVGGQAGKGRHVTTHRELFVLDGGGVLIDNPGIREVGLTGGQGLAASFSELEELARGCRFRDCGHEDEPGCAVRGAVEAGEIDPERLESYHRLSREISHREVVADRGSALAEREKWKGIKKEIRRLYKNGK